MFSHRFLTSPQTSTFIKRSFHTTPFTQAKKKKRVFVKLESSAGTGYTYLKKKSQVSLQRKKVYKKFDPVVNRYMIFTEKKFKRK
mmetsp:Transcript_4609/g.17400  ORF Transcript_4609/g.17400 Transcript_4609/m.17400 type:complete len:85 (+) Transcript_4609:121-375(+)